MKKQKGIILTIEDINHALEIIDSARAFSDKVNLVSGILGKYGELIVAKEILSRRPDLEGQLTFCSGQSSYDLQLGNIPLEVKTSSLKNEGVFTKVPGFEKGRPFFWGWRFKENTTGKEDFRFAILVALKGKEKVNPFDWTVQQFYVVPDQEFSILGEKHIDRYPNIQRGIILFEQRDKVEEIKEHADDVKKGKLSPITKWEVDFNKNPARFQNNWKELFDYLEKKGR